MSDWYLFDAGWFFFAAWTVVVAGVSVAAFRRDFFPSKASHPGAVGSPDKGRSAQRV